MIGITLTADQIRNAPPQVRQWIEQEVMASLGVGAQRPPSVAPPQAAHLVACGKEEAAAILRQIEDQLPAVTGAYLYPCPVPASATTSAPQTAKAISIQGAISGVKARE